MFDDWPPLEKSTPKLSVRSSTDLCMTSDWQSGSTWPPRKNQHPNCQSESYKDLCMSLTDKDVDLTAAEKSTSQLSVSRQRSSVWRSVTVRMSTRPPRKINILSLDCQSDLCRKISVRTVWQIFRPDRREKSTSSQSVSCHRPLYESVTVKVSTWPPRKINILTANQSSKISVSGCDKGRPDSTENQHPNCQSVVRDLCKCRPDRREKSTSWLPVSRQRSVCMSFLRTKCRHFCHRRIQKSLTILTDSQDRSKIAAVRVCDKEIFDWLTAVRMLIFRGGQVTVSQSLSKTHDCMSSVTKCRPDRREKSTS